MTRTSAEGPNDAAALLEELKDIAYRELGETPERKREALDELRKLLSGDNLLHCPTDDQFLIKFLRARKYDVKKSFENIRKYFQARKNMPDMFADLNPASIPFDAVCHQHHLVTLSNGRDSNGRPAAMANPGGWTGEICSLNDFFRLCAVHLEYWLLDEEVQIKGVAIVWDMKGLGFYHLTQFTPSIIRRLFSLVQDCFPLRIKAVYVINNPVIFDILFTIGKPFIKSKLMQRIHLLGYNAEKLRSLVPGDLIPKANGGTHESYDYDEAAKKLQSRAEFFREMNDYGYRNAMEHPS